MLLIESPPAFRSRLIFTFLEPLQRARFPRDVRRIRRPDAAEIPLSSGLAKNIP
jgi:hypothetical protein